MTPFTPPGEPVDRVVALYATAGEIARRSRQPLPTVMKIAIRDAQRHEVPVHDVLRHWAEEADG